MDLGNIRGVYAFDGLAVVVVTDDEPPDFDPEEEPETFEAFENGDYFSVYAFDANGTHVDSIHGMAGYGGPKKAAKAAVDEYFG